MAVSSRLGKRKGDNFPSWGLKKPRSSMVRNTNYSTQSGIAKSFGFRSRKLDGAAYRNKLWDATLMKAHFRSNAAASGSIVTPALPTLATVQISQALDNGVNTFWTSAGGAVDIDAGGTVGAIDGDIILRGGMLGLRVQNNDLALTTGDTIHYQVYLIKGARNANTGSIPSSVPVGWDPTIIPEFINLFGTIKTTKKFVLRPGETMVVEERIPIQKVDQAAWINNNQRWFWVITASNSSDASLDSSLVTRYFNVSFSANFTS